MRSVIFSALLALSIMTCASTVAGTIPLAYLVVEGDGVTSVAAVTELGGPNGGSSRTFNVVCQKPCSIPDYIEKVDEYPIGVFRLSDLENNLITTWVAGSSYVVRVYNLSSSRTTKVLDVHSVQSPEVFVSKNGKSQVRVYVRISQESTRIKPVIWTWNGRAYVEGNGRAYVEGAAQ